MAVEMIQDEEQGVWKITGLEDWDKLKCVGCDAFARCLGKGSMQYLVDDGTGDALISRYRSDETNREVIKQDGLCFKDQ